MAFNFSANQFENAFTSHRLQNWCVSEQKSKRPRTRVGSTVIITDGRGHLLPGKKKSKSAQTDFRGTWDLPSPITRHHINPTSRSKEGLNRLQSWGFSCQHSTIPVGGSRSPSNYQRGPTLKIRPPSQSSPPPTEPHQDPEAGCAHVSISAYVSIPQAWDSTLGPEQTPAGASDAREVIAEGSF
ncbi:protein Flattop [Gouania willdenowi]|uniref:Protein Flattop n=1 Tax=Gouania willdenowi TaxID=441366 RepID=A0A8C5DUP1_GOUWI|nr:protein Flattop [Gouania willdenowi]